MWVDSLFQAVKEIFGFAKQATDPEVVRLNKISALEADLDKERKTLDDLLANEKSNPADLGLCVNRIILLRKKRDSLRKQ